MLRDEKPLWSYEGETHVVWEVEHLFGFDVVVGLKSEGYIIPNRIIARDEAMDGLQRRWAVQLVAALDDGRWDSVAANTARLHGT